MSYKDNYQGDEMKLVLLHGPPAVGKLTVAKELSKLTGIPLFHNHLTRDMVEGIYGGKLYDNYELVDRLRVEALSYCAKHDTDLIFTYVYEDAADIELDKRRAYGFII